MPSAFPHQVKSRKVCRPSKNLHHWPQSHSLRIFPRAVVVPSCTPSWQETRQEKEVGARGGRHRTGLKEKAHNGASWQQKDPNSQPPCLSLPSSSQILAKSFAQTASSPKWEAHSWSTNCRKDPSSPPPPHTHSALPSAGKQVRGTGKGAPFIFQWCSRKRQPYEYFDPSFSQPKAVFV